MKISNPNERLMLYLLRCAVNRRVPERDKLKGVDMDAFFKLCDKHMVAALVAHALSPYLKDSELFTPEQAKTWSEKKSNNIRRTLMYQGERQKIASFFEKNQIWYMPLKGSILQEMYPEYGLREMVDVDMLFDEKGAEKLRDFMVENGYKVEEYDISKHDVYEKPPMYSFEMHRYLVNTRFKPDHDYYMNIKDKLIRQGDSFEYRFSDDDFYVSIICYIKRDIIAGGVALKLLLDLYVLSQSVKLNREYIDGELEKLEAKESERIALEIINAVFSDDAPEEVDLEGIPYEMLSDILASGSSKTYDKYIQQRVKRVAGVSKGKGAKAKYMVSRLHLTKEQVKAMYPYFHYHKWARPFLIFYRGYAALTFKRSKVKHEMETLKKIK